MKKILLVLLPLVFISILSASHLTPMELNNGLSLMYGGELRARGIMDNDLNKNDGGWFDNRLWLNLLGKIGDNVDVAWTTQVGDIVWQGFGPKAVSIQTRELYLDYQMNWMNTKLRLGQQYWYDHRSLILDDYFSGISADMDLAAMPFELGYVKVNERAPISVHIDDAQMAFANIMFKMPVDWGLMVMYGQDHPSRTADVWVEPYFMFDFAPVTLDLTAVIDQQMFKDIQGKNDSQTGLAVAGKLGVDVGVKLGADVLYVSDKGLNTYSPYYVNGLYLFGNQLPFDGAQINSNFTGFVKDNGDPAGYLSCVLTASYPLNEDLDIFAAVGSTSAEDAIGSEFDLGLNIKLAERLTFNPVLAIGQSGEQIDNDTNMVYMLGGVLKAEF